MFCLFSVLFLHYIGRKNMYLVTTSLFLTNDLYFILRLPSFSFRHFHLIFEFWVHLCWDCSKAGQKPAEGWFLSKWVYKFLPAKNLCAYQDIHIGGGQQQKMCAFQRRTKTTPKGWFWSKWVYKFLPAKNLCTYQDIFHFHSNFP